MSIYLGSNASLEERIKFGQSIDQLDLEKIYTELAALKKENAILLRTEEVLHEQLYFGREVIENIQIAVKQARSVQQARDAVEQQIQEGFFEL